MTRNPNVTIWDGVTEAPDETARGDWMKLVANAGLQWDKAILDYLVAGTPRGRAQGRSVLERRHPVDESAATAEAGEDGRREEDDGWGPVEGGMVRKAGKAGWAGHEVVQAFRPALRRVLRWSLRPGMSAKSERLSVHSAASCAMAHAAIANRSRPRARGTKCRAARQIRWRRPPLRLALESSSALGRRPPPCGSVFLTIASSVASARTRSASLRRSTRSA